MSVRDRRQIVETAGAALLESGKSILASDKIFATVERRFAEPGNPATQENRQSCREMLYTTPGRNCRRLLLQFKSPNSQPRIRHLAES